MVIAVACGLLSSLSLDAQDVAVTRLDLPSGRSHVVSTPSNIIRVSVAIPEVADVVAVGEREVVINGLKAGETDVILWQQGGTRQHFRVSVHSAADRMQIALYVKFAEVRKDALRELGVSARYSDGDVRAGTGIFSNDNTIRPDGTVSIPGNRFLTILTDFDTEKLLAFLEAQEQHGNARVLAEPNLMAANKDSATFLAGGELPIPVVQAGSADAAGGRVTIEYREFGVRLKFLGEIVSDSLVKLFVRPEVSSLDFANAVLISGFRVPALRTRRIESTLDVRRNQSIIISGMFNTEEERVRTGIPLLMDIPILGELFSSTRFQRSETELIVVVTPVVVDPMRPRAVDISPVTPNSAPGQPALDALRQRSERAAEKRQNPPPL
ncbi:MAG: type II and III secretion system protein family protein [Gemmatimonadaceae bacterium]